MIVDLVEAIVLAAGESKRMGEENKLLLPYMGQPVIGHVVDTLLKADINKGIRGDWARATTHSRCN